MLLVVKAKQNLNKRFHGRYFADLKIRGPFRSTIVEVLFEPYDEVISVPERAPLMCFPGIHGSAPWQRLGPSLIDIRFNSIPVLLVFRTDVVINRYF